MNELVQDTTPQLGGNLDVNDFYIINANGDVVIDPPADGKFVVRGDATRGSGGITFNNSTNTVDQVTVKAPALGTYSDYTLTLPPGMGTVGQVLETNGTAATAWVSVLKQNVDNGIPEYSNDTTAGAGGVVVGGIYHTAGALKVRVS